MGKERENPSVNHSQAISTEGFPETTGAAIEALPDRLNRYTRSKQRSREMSRFIETIPETPFRKGISNKKLALLLHECANFLLFRHYYTVDQLRCIKGSFCQKHLLCPVCALRRGGRLVAAYLEKYNQVKKENPGLLEFMVVLTVRHDSQSDLSERFDHLRRGIKLLNQRMRDSKRGKGLVSEFAKVKGYVGSIEVTKGKNGWHPHVNLYLLCDKPLEKGWLIHEWAGITGDSKIIHCEPARHPDQPGLDLCEVMKYALKMADLSLEDNWSAYQVLKGKRLVFSAGCLRGVKVPERLEDETLSDDLPYMDLLYRYMQGKGYCFRGSLHKDDRPMEIRMEDMEQQGRNETPF